MKILAVEFSSELRSAAVVVDGRVAGRAEAMGGRAALALVEAALREAGVEREAVEALAVGIGPGSYTGIRGSIALAQGWQLAAATRVLGVGSHECLAAGAARRGLRGAVNIIIDAQRNEFYLARFDVGAQDWRALEPLRLAAAAEITALAAAGQTIAGPDLDGLFPGAVALHPDAAMTGLLAAGRTDYIPAEKLEPIYLRETNFKKAPPPRVLP